MSELSDLARVQAKMIRDQGDAPVALAGTLDSLADENERLRARLAEAERASASRLRTSDYRFKMWQKAERELAAVHLVVEAARGVDRFGDVERGSRVNSAATNLARELRRLNDRLAALDAARQGTQDEGGGADG